jgi:transcriptional regulator with XRE-family HTH domain
MTEDDYVPPTGPRLREARLAQGLTMQQMAAYLEVGVSYISLVERGKRTPNSRLSYLWSRLLDLPLPEHAPCPPPT